MVYDFVWIWMSNFNKFECLLIGCYQLSAGMTPGDASSKNLDCTIITIVTTRTAPPTTLKTTTKWIGNTT